MAQQVLTVVNQSFVNISDDGQDINLPGNSGSATQTLDHTQQAPSGSNPPSFSQHTRKLRIQGPGRNFGNAGGVTVGKSEGSVENIPELSVSQRGIHQFKGFQIEKHAVGDFAGIYGYVSYDGGLHGQSDEGVTGMTLELNENSNYFHGTVGSTIGMGDIKPVLNHTCGNSWTTDGAFLLNISKSKVSGNMLSKSQPLMINGMQTFLNYLPVTKGCLPISEAIGVSVLTTGAIPVNEYTADAPQPVTVTVKLVQIGGVAKPFTVGSYVSVAGNWFPEQAKLTAVVTNPDGTQTLTMNLRNPNNQCIIFQGGIAGQYLCFGANLRASGMRSSYFAFGSLAGSDLIYGVQVCGGLESDYELPMEGSEAAQADGGPNSDFMLIPGAEIVANADQGYNCTLEQNAVLWAPGDDVENPHFPVVGGTALWITKFQQSPSHPRTGNIGFQLGLGGHGIAGGNVAAVRVRNFNPPSMYRAGGGVLQAINGHELLGPYRSHVYAEFAPQDGGAVVLVENPAGTNATAEVEIVGINFGSGGNFKFRPAVGDWRFDGPVDAPAFTQDGQKGFTGTLTVGQQVTVKNGLIMSVA